MTDDQFEGMDSNEDLISREGDFAKVYEIAGSHDDRPVLMVNLNKYMVQNGWAVAYRYYSDDFIKNEETAKKNKAGIW